MYLHDKVPLKLTPMTQKSQRWIYAQGRNKFGIHMDYRRANRCI